VYCPENGKIAGFSDLFVVIPTSVVASSSVTATGRQDAAIRLKRFASATFTLAIIFASISARCLSK
jgi:hypothetical protein